jgi:uncharacterized protein (TIGR02145 family)
MANRRGRPSWCYYNNDPENGKKYGKLYNWYAVNDPRGLAPQGWKVPSKEDWKQLEAHLGGTERASTKLKSKNWESENKGDNASGFNGRAGGSRNGKDGTFEFIGRAGNWWSSTPSTNFDSYAYNRMLNKDKKFWAAESSKRNFYYVRCLRGESKAVKARLASLKKYINAKIREKGHYPIRYITKSEINDLATVAESDIPWALDNNLGLTLYKLTNEHRDQALGAKWLKRQADHGNSAEAMFFWAMEHSHIEKGPSSYNYYGFDALNIPNDKEIHIEYLKKAARIKTINNTNLYQAYDHYGMKEEAIAVLKEIVLIDNDPKYAYILSLKYRNGEGTPMDVNKANAMLRKAADAGYTSAMTAYGKRLFEGKDGLPLDPTKGMNYLNASCEEGDCSACDYLVRNGITPTKRGSGCN